MFIATRVKLITAPAEPNVTTDTSRSAGAQSDGDAPGYKTFGPSATRRCQYAGNAMPLQWQFCSPKNDRSC
jgi:hypothetical protein